MVSERYVNTKLKCLENVLIMSVSYLSKKRLFYIYKFIDMTF